MAEYKYDLELEITLEDFQNSNYEEVLKEASKEGLTYYHTVLSKEVAKQIEQGNKKAHGLSELGIFNSIESVYLWWLCFKLVVNNSHLVAKGNDNRNIEEDK